MDFVEDCATRCCSTHGCRYGHNDTCVVFQKKAPWPGPCEVCGIDRAEEARRQRQAREDAPKVKKTVSVAHIEPQGPSTTLPQQ